ncbi:MAG: ABC transporter permease [Deltaproteobacteria bacterium]|nr:ABC transporter permease [Deltaproteobacteria bacterium]
MKPNTLRFLSVLTLTAAWEIAGRAGNARLLPPFSKVMSAWFDLLVSGQLFQALAISLQALVIGFLISLAIGVPLGLLMGRYRRLASFLDVYMTALLTVPMISFIPFLVIALGLGLHSRVWIVFLFAFVIIAINTAAGVRNVDPTLTEMAKSFGAKESELFAKVILPAALPMIMAGVRLGMGRAVLGMVTSEMILAVVGFGAMLMTFGASFNSPALFATILTIVLLAVALLALIQFLDRKLTPWRAAT